MRSGVDVRLETKGVAFFGEPRAEAVELESGETLSSWPATWLLATPRTGHLVLV